MKNRNLQVVEKITSEADIALSFIAHHDFDAFNEDELLKRALHDRHKYRRTREEP